MKQNLPLPNHVASYQDELNRPREITSAQVITTAKNAAVGSLFTAQTRQKCELFQSLRGTTTSAGVLA